MKIKFNLDNNLPSNKRIEIPIIAMVVRAVFYENNKYYPQVSWDEYLYKLQKCYIMIELTFLKGLILINQAHQKRVMIVSICISYIMF